MVASQASLKFKYLLGVKSTEQFEGVIPANKNDSDGIASSGKLTAVCWDRPGTFACFKADSYQKFDVTIPLCHGHQGIVNDLQFSPFNDQLLASGSDDTTCKLWIIDPNGITQNINEADAELKGHSKKVLYTRWHPIVENTLATASSDLTVKLWDVEQQEDVMTFHDDKFKNIPTSLRWSYDGKMLAMNTRTSSVFLFDPRKEDAALIGAGHTGPKSQKCVWLKDNQSILTSGFNRTNQREFAVWDLRDMTQPLYQQALAPQTGASHLHFDPEHELLYIAGRGESKVEYYQYNRENPQHLTYLDSFQTPQTTKAFAFVPKWGSDVEKHEIQRGVRINSANQLNYISFRLANKTGQFQDHLYPPFQGNKPTGNFSEWCGGKDFEPNLMQLQAKHTERRSMAQKKGFLNKLKGGDANVEEIAEEQDTSALQAKVDALEADKAKLQAENDELKKRVEELEAQVKIQNAEETHQAQEEQHPVQEQEQHYVQEEQQYQAQEEQYQVQEEQHHDDAQPDAYDNNE